MGLYTITTRAEGTVLTGFGSLSNIFNVDHLNHVTHTAAAFLNSWEDTLAHMQLTAAPTSGVTLSLPTALKDEIERLRFEIAKIKQTLAGAATPPFWYTAAADFTNFISLSPAAARLEQSTNVQIASNIPTTMTFNTVIYDTASLAAHDAGVAGTASFKIPADGTYIVGATLAFGDGVTDGPQGNFLVELQLVHPPATTTVIAADQIWSGASSEPKSIVVETVKRCQLGDSIFCIVTQTDGTPKSPVTQPDSRPAFWIALVGRG